MSRVLSIKEVQEHIIKILRAINEISTRRDLHYCLAFGTALGAIRHAGPIPWDYDIDLSIPITHLDHFCEVLEEEFQGSPYRVVRPGDKSIEDNITTFPRVTYKNVNPRKMHIDLFPLIGITSDRAQQESFIKSITAVKTLYRDKQVAYTKTGEWWKRLGKLGMRVKLAGVDSERTLSEFRQLCFKYPFEDSEYVSSPCGPYGMKGVMPKAYFGNLRRVCYMDMMLPVPEQTDAYLTHVYGNYMEFPPKKERDRLMKYTVTIED